MHRESTEPGSTSVWVVSSGEYSDWGIDLIFATEEDADAYAAAGGGQYVEKYPTRSTSAPHHGSHAAHASCAKKAHNLALRQPPAGSLKREMQAMKERNAKRLAERDSA